MIKLFFSLMLASAIYASAERPYNAVVDCNGSGEIVALTTEPRAAVSRQMKCGYKVHAVNASGVIGKRAT